MEVHHHPEVPHGEKKRFKEYILEFLMIFLAVTMGFIAENIREHISDSSKEHEYITGLIKNLEVDTARIAKTRARNLEQIKGIDTLRSISRDKLNQLKVQDSLYMFTMNYLFHIVEFKNDDVTLSELRNSGGFRLIRNEAVLDSIEVYEKNISALNEQLTYVFGSISKIIEMSETVFDLNAGVRFQKAPETTPVLITTDKQKINEFYNKCFLATVSVKGYNQMLKSELKYSTMLIAYLKKEYDVE